MSEIKLAEISQIFLGFGLLFLALKEFQSFLRPFVVSLILTFLFVPFTRLSKERRRNIWISTLGVIVTIFLIGMLISGFLFSETQDVEEINPQNKLSRDSSFSFFNSYKFTFANEEISMGDYFNSEEIDKMILNFLNSFISSLGTFFSEFLLVILFLIFLLPSHDMTVKKIAKKLDRNSKKKFISALDEIEHNIRIYLSIKTLVSLLTALLSALIMGLFRVDFLILFTVLIFTLNFIPSIGSIFAVSIVMISELINSGFSFSFLVLGVLLTLIQVLVGNILEPKISGKELELSPVVILLSLFFWGSVWGIGGALLAVPLTSIIKIVLQNIDSTKKIVPFLS